MKTLTLILLATLIGRVGFGQNRQEVDSLKHQFALVRHDTDRVIILVALSDKYRFTDSAQIFGRQALTLARKIKYPKGEVRALTFLCRALAETGNLPKGFQGALTALQIAETHHLEEESAATLNQIGNLYTALNDIPKALDYYKQSLGVFKKYHNQVFVSQQNMQIGRAFAQLNRLDSALYYEQLAYSEMSDRQKTDEINPLVYRNLAYIYFKLGKTALALEHARKGLHIAYKSNNHVGITGNLIEMAGFFQKINQRDSSLYYTKLALAKAQQTLNKRIVLRALTLLSSLYESTDTKEAFRYYKMATAVNDSLFGAGNIKAIQELLAQEEERKKEVEATQIKYQNQLKLYALLAGLAIMLLIGFILYRNNRQKHKANLVLENTLNDLKISQSDLELKNRDLEIEAALERVRSRTMSMHQSEELAEVTTLLFQQISQLGGMFDRFSIGIIDERKGIVDIWSTDRSGQQLNKRFVARLDEKTTLAKMHAGWKSGQKSQIIDLVDEEFWEWIRYAREEMGIQVNENQLKGRRVHNLAYFSQGYLSIHSNEPLASEIRGILERFANVFNLTYTRFLDLQKAEAQLREAQIESALETVRSRSLAMNRSDELKEVMSVMFTKMKELNVVLGTIAIQFFDTKTHTSDLWVSNDWQEPALVKLPYDQKMITEDYCLKDCWEAKIKGKNIFNKVYSFEQKEAFFDYVFANNDLDTIPSHVRDIIQQTQSHNLCLIIEKNSALFVDSWNGQLYNTEQFEVLKRSAKVFEQAYTRFLDLKKAEDREREAIRQASLDRVRAEIASMRTKNDLQRITPLIWKELTALTVPFIRCGVFIMDETAEKVHTYLSTPDGQAIASFDLPYTSPGITPEVVAHWRNRQRFSDHWDEAQFRAWTQSLVEQGLIQSKESYVSEAPPQQLSLYFLPFQQGMLYVGNRTPLSHDEIQLAQVLADAFSTAYARYQDFNELEETKLQAEKALAKLQSTQAQLIQKEKLASLGELTAGIAHEIQNPLNFVNNFSEVSVDLANELDDEMNKPELDRDLISDLTKDLKSNQEKINLHGKRASSIVKGMLEHSRTSTGIKELTDMNQLADEYLRLSYHGLRAKDKDFNADFKTAFDGNLPKIEVIPQDMGRVLLNLINNAFWAAKTVEKPLVMVKTEHSNNQLIIKVTDNGTGMSEATKAKIFQPFFTTKPTGEGTGLGLSLAYDIVTKGHGGTIEVESVEGEGTTFIVKLPIQNS
jgi:signal transduction histidine kinase